MAASSIPDLKRLEEDARAAIRAAFRDDDPPPSEEMENDHCVECREVSAVLCGKRWVDVTASGLAGNLPVSLLTESAFRYHLPALMLRCLEAPSELGTIVEGVIGQLSAPNGKARTALRGQLEPAQRVAVATFLTVCEAREKLESFPPEAFDSAPVSKPLARAIAYWGEAGASAE